MAVYALEKFVCGRFGGLYESVGAVEAENIEYEKYHIR